MLSPARCDGRRAKILLNPRAAFELAVRVRSSAGAPIGEVFSFLSGLYFRGKMAYASAFGAGASWVITTNRGLVTPETAVTRSDLLSFAKVDLGDGNARFRRAMLRDASALRESLGGDGRVVLLGSIATGKYTDVLVEVFGERLVFPTDFVGRGDMSRGGLMLRCADEGRELAYAPVVGAVRHGKRPPKLERRQ